MKELGSNVVCPNGHISDDRDLCSVCGATIPFSPRVPDSGVKIASRPTVPNSAPPAPSPRTASAASFEAPEPSGPSVPAGAGSDGVAPVAGASECPYCSSELDTGAHFCEVCGYDPATGSMPAAPVPQPVLLPPAPLPAVPTAAPKPSHPASVPPSPSSPTATPRAGAAGRLIAVVAADRAYYDSQQVGEVLFPVGAPPRTIELPAGPATIGRRSRTLGTEPAIDLAVPPEDPAVSHIHASLLPSDDGTWTVVDHGSTNGTYLNESPEPLTANVPRAIRLGDRIYVGAWTRITLELRSSR